MKLLGLFMRKFRLCLPYVYVGKRRMAHGRFFVGRVTFKPTSRMSLWRLKKNKIHMLILTPCVQYTYVCGSGIIHADILMYTARVNVRIINPSIYRIDKNGL